MAGAGENVHGEGLDEGTDAQYKGEACIISEGFMNGLELLMGIAYAKDGSDIEDD